MNQRFLSINNTYNVKKKKKKKGDSILISTYNCFLMLKLNQVLSAITQFFSFPFLSFWGWGWGVYFNMSE